MMMAGSWAANLEPAMQVCSPIPGPAEDIVVVYKVDRLTPSPAFCATGRDLRRTGRVLRVGDAAIQYDELEGGPHAQCAAVVVSSSSGRSPASASATSLLARLIPLAARRHSGRLALYRSADGRDHSRQSVRSHDIGREVPGSPKAVNSRVKPTLRPLRLSAPKTACTAIVRAPKEHRADT
jgi:hypothetical protein